MSRLHLIWRIIYHSLYYFLSLILLLLLCVTPADAIRQSYLNKQRFHILIVIICLSVALAAVVCIYFFRLYVTRNALANIPKSYVPIEKGEVRKDVRQMIVAALSRSAAIAYESRPRVEAARPATATTQEGKDGGEEEDGNAQLKKKVFKILGLKKAATVEERMGITLPPHGAVWGEIEHYGWASPNSPDLPNLQYSTVISELPNLIEAKALTLAPSIPNSETGESVLDPYAIELLQRPEILPLRQYLARLAELGVLPASRTTADFLSSYEHARYSTRPVSNARFRELMHLFAEILRTMEPLDASILPDLEGTHDSASSSDIDNHAPRESPSTPRSRISPQPSLHRQASTATTSTSSSSSSSSNASQIRRRRPNASVRHSSQGTWAGTYRTAPTTPKSRRPATGSSSAGSSVNSFAQTTRPFTGGAGGISGSSSNVSLGSAGSVIRLSERAGMGDLPYVLSLADTRQ